jgi:tetratricopeptide (TPR) repeat protein
MSLIHYNSLRIVGNNNLVLQGIDGSQISLTIEAFISNITAEKDKLIAALERTIEDKVKLEHYSIAEKQNLGRELTQLKEERHYLEQRIEEMLREFDGKDLSTTSKMYQEAFNLFVSGQLQEAIDFLTEDKMAAEEAKAQAIIKQQAETRRLKADMLVLTFDFTGAEHNYEKAVALFPSWGNHLTTANFYINQKNYQKVERHYQLSLNYAENDEQKATTLNNLGNYYRANQKMLQAEAVYNEALIIRRELADKNPDAFLLDVAMTLNNLGVFYSDNQKMLQAEAAYQEALSIQRQLAELNPDIFLSYVATTLNNIGKYYYDNQKMPEAEAAFKEALNIYRELVNKKTDAFLPDLASTLNNLGEYFRVNRKIQQAEAAYNEALDIQRQLASKNPDAYLLDLANTLNNLGNYYDSQKMPEAEALFKEALNIYRQLAGQNPDAFISYVAATSNNLGVFYGTYQKIPQAEAAFSEALNIYKQLAVKNPDAFLSYVAATLNNLGLYYFPNQNMPQAEVAFFEALNIYRQLVITNPGAFLPDLAKTLNNIVLFNFKKPEKAEKYLKESLPIMQKLVYANPDAQNIELIRILILGGFIYEALKNTTRSQECFKEALFIAEKYPQVPFAQQVIETAKRKIEE